ncbi:DUF4333 domain-containing protein [Georgenia subflava]|uniref:DUF4333 domain-containing protein n=1 Tax=Georgenia subflava TaxID=1622177 RepID=A0A6N7EJP0_9MICO|nr:DUF4333 domain-containing protein [Georgenia subflava]MPV37641.1 DUF4333 domain-containing protein [Georgenia subflava]
MRRPADFRRPGALLVLTGAAVLLLTACGAQQVEPIPADLVAERIADALEEEVGQRPVIECSEELPAEVGAEVVCDLTTQVDPETIYPVTATVTAVDTDTGEVDFDVVVADAPAGSEG